MGRQHRIKFEKKNQEIIILKLSQKYIEKWKIEETKSQRSKKQTGLQKQASSSPRPHPRTIPPRVVERWRRTKRGTEARNMAAVLSVKTKCDSQERVEGRHQQAPFKGPAPVTHSWAVCKTQREMTVRQIYTGHIENMLRDVTNTQD